MQSLRRGSILLFLLAVGALWFIGNLSVDEKFAVDWRMFWRATHNFHIDYTRGLVFNPPWTLALLWPFTVFPLPTSLALFSLFTLACLGVFLKRDNDIRRWGLTLLLVSISYPVLRELVDGNLDVFVVAGLLLFLWADKKQSSWGLAGAVVLLSIKFQESWMLVLAIGFYVIRDWPKPKIWKAVLLTFAYIAPFLIANWRPWLDSIMRFPAESAFNSSLVGTLARIGAPTTLTIVLWLLIFIGTLWGIGWKKIGRQESGLLVTASMLLAPYSGNSVLVPFIVGTDQALQRGSAWGALLLVLYNIPYLFIGQVELRINWEYTYWCVVLFLTWISLILMSRKNRPLDSSARLP